MPTKTQIERAERDWRHFVFDSRFTRVVFFCGILVFLSGMFTPHTTTQLLMERVIPIWFGCFLLYSVSAHLLTLIVSVIRRDVLTTVWMFVWTGGLSVLASYILLLGLGFRGGFVR